MTAGEAAKQPRRRYAKIASSLAFSVVFGGTLLAGCKETPASLLYISAANPGTVHVYTQSDQGLIPLGCIVGFQHPAGLAVDGTGKLYVADQDANTVTVFERGKSFPYETLTGAMHATGITLDSVGSVYVTNGSETYIYVYRAGSPTPMPTPLSANGTGGLHGVAVDAAGNTFFAVRNTIQEVPSGASTALPSPIRSDLSDPRTIVFDSSQNLVVSDAGLHTIFVYNSPYTNPTPLASFTNANAQVDAIALDQEHSALWLADTHTGAVTKLNYPLGPAPTPVAVLPPSLGLVIGIAIDQGVIQSSNGAAHGSYAPCPTTTQTASRRP